MPNDLLRAAAAPCAPPLRALRARGGGGKSSKQAKPEDLPGSATTTPHRRPPAAVDLNALQAVNTEHNNTMDSRLWRALREMDSKLEGALASGDIKLIRTAWVNQPSKDRGGRRPGLIRPRRELEVLQAECERDNYTPTPLLYPEEAVEMLKRGDRSIGVLSHGWLSTAEPDPDGKRLGLLRRALVLEPQIEAVFWDYGSLHQRPRDDEQQSAFVRALDVMGDLYASATATCVLQIREVPPRPEEYDGHLCLFGVKPEADELAVRLALVPFGDIKKCELRPTRLGYPAIVRFTSYDAVRGVLDDPEQTWRGLAKRVAPFYNDTSYDGVHRYGHGRSHLDGTLTHGDLEAEETDDAGRGWCIFEDAASRALLTRLATMPKVQALLDTLPPKMLALVTGESPSPIDVLLGAPEAQKVDEHVEGQIERMRVASYHEVADADRVAHLYESYVHRMEAAVRDGIAIVHASSALAGDESADEHTGLNGVMSGLPEPASLQLTKTQLVLLAPDVESRREGGAGATQLATVQKDGRRVEPLFADGLPLPPPGIFPTLTLDECSGRVLPWRPIKTQSDAKQATRLAEDVKTLYIVRGVIFELSERCAKMPPEQKGRKQTQEELAVLASAQGLVPFLSRMRSKALRQAYMPLQKRIEGILMVPPTQPPLDLAELRAFLDPIASTAMQSLTESGEVGLRCYLKKQMLIVRLPDGRWMDAQVVETSAAAVHHLELAATREKLELALHPWNHAPRELPLAAFDELRRRWVARMQDKFVHVDDAFTGMRLHVQETCIYARASLDAATQRGHEITSPELDATDLVNWMLLRRRQVSATQFWFKVDRPLGVVIIAGPSRGKTVYLQQVLLSALAADTDGDLVPIYVHVRKLQRRRLHHGSLFATAFNWVDAYLRVEHEKKRPALYRMLRQALTARRALLLLDGLDAIGVGQEAMEQHVSDVLGPQGHLIVATTRPEPTEGTCAVEGLAHLHLLPLTHGDQSRLVELHYEYGKASALLSHAHHTMPEDDETEQPLTALPVMLMMCMWVSELTSSMPTTAVGVYEVAVRACFARLHFKAGTVAASHAPRLPKAFTALCIELHLVEILHATSEHFERATARRQACVSHEYEPGSTMYASVRKKEEKVVAMLRGLVADEKFLLVTKLATEPLLVRAAHKTVQDYCVATAICDVRTWNLQLAPWELSAFWANTLRLGAEMGEAFGRGLLHAGGFRGAHLDLSGKLGGHRPTVMLAVQQLTVGLNSLKRAVSLTLSGNHLSDDNLQSMMAGLLESNAITSLDLSENDLTGAAARMLSELLEESETLRTLILAHNPAIKEAGATHLASALAENETLAHLDLEDTGLGGNGAETIADALGAGNTALVQLSLAGNRIKDEGVAFVSEKLAANSTLTRLDLRSNELSKVSMRTAAHFFLNPNRSRTELYELNLGYNRLEEQAIGDIGAVLTVNTCLRTLHCDRCYLEPEAARRLAEGLKFNRTVTDLSLSGNPLGPEGVGHLAATGLHAIQTLNLSDTGFGNDGARHLAGCMRFNMSLNVLNLADTDMTDDGARHLANGLAYNWKLRELNVSWNCFNSPINAGSLGAAAEAAAADTGAHGGSSELAKRVLAHGGLSDFCGIPLATLREDGLEELDLRNEGIGLPGILILTELLPTATSLTRIDVRKNGLDNLTKVQFLRDAVAVGIELDM